MTASRSNEVLNPSKVSIYWCLSNSSYELDEITHFQLMVTNLEDEILMKTEVFSQDTTLNLEPFYGKHEEGNLLIIKMLAIKNNNETIENINDIDGKLIAKLSPEDQQKFDAEFDKLQLKYSYREINCKLLVFG